MIEDNDYRAALKKMPGKKAL
jgi:hypothetical protein